MTDLRAECDPSLLERDRCQIGCHPVRWATQERLTCLVGVSIKISGVPERRHTFGLNIKPDNWFALSLYDIK
jgi:hypothetical protein